MARHQDIFSRIRAADFLLIAEAHLGVPAIALGRMPRVLTLAEAALGAPFAGFGAHELFPTLEQKAGVYCARIAQYHPLPDANKRVAYDVMVEFVERNGRAFTHGAGGLAETAHMIERIAGDTDPPISEAEFLAWVARRVR